ncbi:MAG: acetylxylan esterase, partial [bacterium]
PAEPPRPRVQITGTLDGDGFCIDKLVFQSRPGLWVTAHLYRPADPPEAMPGLLLVHSHHAPKEQRELQDMGMTWARHGCLVLVPDLLGHGERRQHPFATAADYAGDFRLGRQDYYFRYDAGMQLHLAGETLMGWMVWDLWRSVDVLLARPGIDAERIVILGAVAGGGDPAAVAAALDPRIGGAVVYNFGGAEPETPYPLPEDAEQTLAYAGSGSFETTRNLARSAADGFLPWVIVGAIAPRPLVYAHEFAWDRERDPVWTRLQRIWGFYDAGDRLAGIHGRGSVKGRPPEATHCTNIGRLHRADLHPLLARWFGIRVAPDDEYSAPRERDELRCMTPALAAELEPRKLCTLLAERADERLAALRRGAEVLDAQECRRRTRAAWAAALGDVEPDAEPTARVLGSERRGDGERAFGVERLALTVEPGIVVPALLLRPEGDDRRWPCVVAVAQGGKAAFLRHRAEEVAALLAGGAAVCLPDVRGTGETRPEGSRQRWGALTNQASTELMLGGTMVGARLRDLRAVLDYLRDRADLDPARMALWGDSFAAPNPRDRTFAVPRNVDGRPAWSEPLGGLLALLGGLFEDDVAAVYVRGGLADVRSALDGPFVYLPPDAIVPGLLEAGDLPDLAAALAPHPLRLDAPVDALNRRVPAARLDALYGPARDAYRGAGAAGRLDLRAEPQATAPWLLAAFGGP